MEWLIKRFVELGVMAVLYGPSGEGKSFAAIDWALCIAMGFPWQGHAVKNSPVVYVVAEGGRNTRKRVRAWMLEHGIDDVPDMFVLLEPVQLRNHDDLNVLLGRIGKPFDSPATCFRRATARWRVGAPLNA